MFTHDQHGYKVVVNYRLVMRNRPVLNLTRREINTCISIIKNLRNGGLRVSRVIEQTSPDRTHVINMINILKKGDIVTKPKARQGQPKEVSLTDIGNHLINLMQGVQEYTKSWKELDNAMVERFEYPYLKEEKRSDSLVLSFDPLLKKAVEEGKEENFVRIYDDKTLPAVLKNRGWNDDEVDLFLYEKCRPPHGMSELLDRSPSIVINIILYKYLILLISELNETAKVVIQKIIIDLITEVVAYIQISRYPKEIPEIQRVLDRATKEAMTLTSFVAGGEGFFYKFMIPEVFGLLGSIFTIVNPRKDYLKKELDRHIEFVKEEKLKAEIKSDYYWDESKGRIVDFLEGLIKKYVPIS